MASLGAVLWTTRQQRHAFDIRSTPSFTSYGPNLQQPHNNTNHASRTIGQGWFLCPLQVDGCLLGPYGPHRPRWQAHQKGLLRRQGKAQRLNRIHRSSRTPRLWSLVLRCLKRQNWSNEGREKKGNKAVWSQIHFNWWYIFNNPDRKVQRGWIWSSGWVLLHWNVSSFIWDFFSLRRCKQTPSDQLVYRRHPKTGCSHAKEKHRPNDHQYPDVQRAESNSQ